jgi:hypothetical protein
MTAPTINGQAPVLLAGEIEIAASPELVWDVLTAIDDWPSWNPEVSAAALEGELAPGSVFRWKAGLTLRSTLKHVEAPRMIAWTGSSMGLDVVHVYGLEPRDDKTFVKTVESVEGVMARLFRWPLQKKMDKSIENGLRSLKVEAERLATSYSETEPSSASARVPVTHQMRL